MMVKNINSGMFIAECRIPEARGRPWGWIAQDFDGSIYLYTEEPIEALNQIMWMVEAGECYFLYLGRPNPHFRYYKRPLKQEEIEAGVVLVRTISVEEGNSDVPNRLSLVRLGCFVFRHN